MPRKATSCVIGAGSYGGSAGHLPGWPCSIRRMGIDPAIVQESGNWISRQAWGSPSRYGSRNILKFAVGGRKHRSLRTVGQGKGLGRDGSEKIRSQIDVVRGEGSGGKRAAPRGLRWCPSGVIQWGEKKYREVPLMVWEKAAQHQRRGA